MIAIIKTTSKNTAGSNMIEIIINKALTDGANKIRSNIIHAHIASSFICTCFIVQKYIKEINVVA